MVHVETLPMVTCVTVFRDSMGHIVKTVRIAYHVYHYLLRVLSFMLLSFKELIHGWDSLRFLNPTTVYDMEKHSFK